MKVLLVEDDRAFRQVLADSLRRDLGEGVEVVTASTLEDARACLEHGPFDLFLLDIAFPQTRQDAERGKVDPRAGVQLLETMAAREEPGRVVVVSSQEKELAVKLLVSHQVHEYIFKDTPWKEIRARLQAQLEQLRLQSENRLLRRALGEADPSALIGGSPALRQALARVDQVAATDATVLILGETGTGKELFARRVHEQSPRHGGPFVVVNCAALSESVLESELFGHRKGAFTGAVEDRLGRFEVADGGTLFLDEVGEIPLHLQPKLLRVLQEQTFERVGESAPRTVDVRVVSATNRDLEAECRAGRFREDLFYRLNVFPLTLPPLRERHGDVLQLAEHFLRRAARKYGRPTQGLTPQAAARLEGYSWPGNVRQLEHTIESAVILETDVRLGAANLPPLPGEAAPPDARELVPHQAPALPPAPPAGREPMGYQEAMRGYETAFLQRKLLAFGGDTAQVAAAVGLPVRTLRDRLRKCGLDPRRFRG